MFVEFILDSWQFKVVGYCACRRFGFKLIFDGKPSIGNLRHLRKDAFLSKRF